MTEQYTEQFLLDKIQQLRKNEEEIINKIREDKSIKQRAFITYKMKEYIGMDLTDDYFWAFIFAHQPHFIKYYVKPEDKNILLERKLINYFASQESIRYEDSEDVLTDFVTNLKPINSNEQNNANYIPIFVL